MSQVDPVYDFIQTCKSGEIELICGGREFNYQQFWLYCKEHAPTIQGEQVRELLRPYEREGIIRYTEMMCWEICSL